MNVRVLRATAPIVFLGFAACGDETVAEVTTGQGSYEEPIEPEVPVERGERLDSEVPEQADEAAAKSSFGAGAIEDVASGLSGMDTSGMGIVGDDVKVEVEGDVRSISWRTISMQELPEMPPDAAYANDALVLVRPDGIIADHWRDGDVDDAEGAGRLARYLPLA